MPSLPLKVQVGIRDHWSNKDSPLQKSLQELNELLGHTASVDPEWPQLLAELDSLYADKNNFVTIIAGCVQTWAKSLMELLEDTAHEEWTETLVERTAEAGSLLRVFLEVAPDANATTSWSDQRQGFVIRLPKAQVYQPVQLFPVFRGALLTSFEPEEKKRSIANRTAAAGAADDWADVEVDTSTGTAKVVETTKAPAVASAPTARCDFMPTVASLPRPDELLLRPPYHIVMYASHTEIEIHGSHSPSLQLMADYLKRWCRVNHHDSRAPPGVDVKLHQSAFGLGEMFDRLVLSTRDTRYTEQFRVTAPIVVSLIEGILGYECVSSQSSTWNFKREAEFKRL